MREKLPKEKEHLVLDNLNMVHHILQKKLHIYLNNPSYEDYYQEGVIGLIISAIRFEEERGFKFSTYAFPTVIGVIQRYRRDFEPAIHYSRRLKDTIFTVLKYQAQGFTLTEIEEFTGITSSDIQDALNVTQIASLEKEIGLKDNSSVSFGDTIASPRNDYEEMLSEERCLVAIQQVSDTIIDDTYRGIWEEYIYGLMYGEKLTQNYFANKYGISQAQISRQLKRYKNKFVKYLSE